MNEKIILDMVASSLAGNELPYSKFEQIFSMLSLQEQYGVLEVLAQNGIELVDSYSTIPKEEMDSTDEEEIVDFSFLNNDELFADNPYETNAVRTSNENRKDLEEQETEFLVVRKKVHLPNKTLVKLIQEGSAQAKQDLCVRNRRLVDKVVGQYKKLLGNRLEFEDLEQAGMLGMIIAAEKFDLSLGTEFSTYAVWWIKQAVIREIQDNGFLIRIPVHRLEQIHRVMKSDSSHADELDYYKRIQMISDELGMDIPLVEECIRLYYQLIGNVSLDVPVGEDEDISLGDMIPYEREKSIEELAMDNALKEQLDEALQSLSERERDIIILRFGLRGNRVWTLEELGELFHITRERVRQIEMRALRRLRSRSKREGLEEFL